MGKSVSRAVEVIEDVVDAEVVIDAEQATTALPVLVGESVSSPNPIFDEVVELRGVNPLDPWAVDAIARHALANGQGALFV